MCGIRREHYLSYPDSGGEWSSTPAHRGPVLWQILSVGLGGTAGDLLQLSGLHVYWVSVQT
jgi:hypothetical protein